MPGLSGIKAIAAGDGTFLALGSDGTVYDSNGTAIDGAGPAIAIATGSDHYMTLKADGTVWAWGGNGDFGQCGVDPKLADVVDKPTQVPNLSGVVALADSWRQSLALKADGTVWAWGRNDSGQLGDGTATPAQYRYQAGPVVNLTDVIAISGGIAHSAAVKSDGTLWVWGNNGFGQLGAAVEFQTTTPVQVQLPPSATAKVVAVAAGRQHTVILYGPK
jgi:alpha-tubulin suppressor-like RCC1 family protein